MVRYEIDPAHTNIGFSAKHLAVTTVHGHFAKFEGALEGPDDDLTQARGTVKVSVASLDTRNEQRDNHLRSADFFDVEKYPYLTFAVTGIEKLDDETYRVKGDLTIKDTTRPIELTGNIEGRLADPFGGLERLGVSASGQVNRMDFGLNWDGVAGAVPFAGHVIKINLDAEIVVKAAEAAEAVSA
ncbi:MAG TPA: YceI family protein [Candidatus Dormibacteraeota bacterium]|nr:YceI family protein [Candidatus Dormibacteraeota bacterium]